LAYEETTLLCEKVLTCSKTGIKRHEVSKKHQEKVKTTTTMSSLRQMINQVTTADAKTAMEVKLCAFIAQHNLPLSLSQDMVERFAPFSQTTPH
jgi:hypothetical protein